MGITDFFPDTSTFPENVYGFCQLIYIAATYLFVLMNASRMISHGSELLLLVPAVAGIVGSIILPIMSSVPDGALVIFSGLGDDAQEKLQVGVGSLAGATIMLLTVPWFIAVFIGRVDVDPSTGLANYTNKPKLSGQYNVMQTGVSITSAVRKRGYVLLITAIPYLIVQVPGMFYMNDTVEQQANGEKWYALAAFILCTIFFALYLLNEYMQSDEEASISYEIKLEYIREAINKQEITIIGVMAGLLEPHKKSSMSRSGKRCSLSDTLNRQVVNDLKSLLHPFFKLYDIDNSETLQIDELMFVFKDLGEKNMDRDDIEELWKDEDLEEGIDYETFVHGIYTYICSHAHLLNADTHRHRTRNSLRPMSGKSIASFLGGGIAAPNSVDTHYSIMNNSTKSNDDPEINVSSKSAGYRNLESMVGVMGMEEEEEYTIAECGYGDPQRKLQRRISRKESSKKNRMSQKLASSRSADSPSKKESTKESAKESTYGTLHGGSLSPLREGLRDDIEEDTEVEEMPADLCNLTPEQQQTIIIRRAILSMSVGAAIILIFSDPMVNVLVDLGNRTGVPAFYVSFLFAPLAGNIPEVLAAFTYSARKTTKSTRIALATLQGSTILNNTFVMALFMALVFARSLAWEFFAETLTVLIAEVAVFFFSLKKTHTVLDATLILLIYPLSLAMIVGLTLAGWD